MPDWLPTVQDIQGGLTRVLLPDEATLANSLIEEAYIRLAAVVPTLAELVQTPTGLERARLVIMSAVRRVLRNPAALDGYASESEGGYSYSLQGALSNSATIWFPDTDLALLTGQSRARRGSIHLQRPTRSW